MKNIITKSFVAIVAVGATAWAATTPVNNVAPAPAGLACYGWSQYGTNTGCDVSACGASLPPFDWPYQGIRPCAHWQCCYDSSSTYVGQYAYTCGWVALPTSWNYLQGCCANLDPLHYSDCPTATCPTHP